MTFTEYKTVEKEILDCLQSAELGWRYEPGDEVSARYRGGDEQEMLLLPILHAKLKELNPGVITDDEREHHHPEAAGAEGQPGMDSVAAG